MPFLIVKIAHHITFTILYKVYEIKIQKCEIINFKNDGITIKNIKTHEFER